MALDDDKTGAHGPEPAHENASGGCNCPACNPRPTTPEDEAAINEDPGMRSLSRALGVSFHLLKLVLLLLLGFLFLDCFTYVKQGNVGLVKRFGKYLSDGEKAKQFKPGQLVFVWPSPIEEFDEVPLSQQRLSLDREFWPLPRAGQNPDDPDALGENAALDPAADGYNLTGDLNILHSKWNVEYRVDAERPELYRLAVADALKPGVQATPGAELKAADRLAPEDILRSLATAAVMKCMAGMAVDDILYDKQKELVDRITAALEAELDGPKGEPLYGIRLVRVTVTNQPPTPPGSARAAFSAVTGARNEKSKIEAAAQGEYNEIVRQAKGEADAVVKQAQTYRAEVVSRAKGDAGRVSDLLAKFPDDPAGLRVYLQQYRYQRLKNILAAGETYYLRRGQNWFIVGEANDSLFGNADQKKDGKETKK